MKLLVGITNNRNIAIRAYQMYDDYIVLYVPQSMFCMLCSVIDVIMYCKMSECIVICLYVL